MIELIQTAFTWEVALLYFLWSITGGIISMWISPHILRYIYYDVHERLTRLLDNTFDSDSSLTVAFLICSYVWVVGRLVFVPYGIIMLLLGPASTFFLIAALFRTDDDEE
tara:strand:- start:13814 stop:14143 length:330 start_codon:yes stop_codon:yes gene_type:complete